MDTHMTHTYLHLQSPLLHLPTKSCPITWQNLVDKMIIYPLHIFFPTRNIWRYMADGGQFKIKLVLVCVRIN